MKIEDCSICMKKIKLRDRTHTACNHIFHFSCLVENMKHNFNTGYLCPLCRNAFIKPEHQTNSVFSRPLASSPWPAIGFSMPRPVPRSLAIHGNRIIQPSRVQRPIQRRQAPPASISEENEEEEERITKFIDELNYEALKQELRSRGLSTRGYLRSSFEKRLFNAMRSQ